MDRRLALGVLGVLTGPLEALHELCGEVGVVQLHGCQAAAASPPFPVCATTMMLGISNLLSWVQFAAEKSAQVATAAAVTRL